MVYTKQQCTAISLFLSVMLVLTRSRCRSLGTGHSTWRLLQCWHERCRFLKRIISPAEPSATPAWVAPRCRSSVEVGGQLLHYFRSFWALAFWSRPSIFEDLAQLWVKPRGDFWPLICEANALVMLLPVHQAERHGPRDHLPSDNGKWVYIHLLTVWLILRHFGRHVANWPSVACHIIGGRIVTSLALISSTQPKIYELDHSLPIKCKIIWFQVAVSNSLAVHVLKSCHELAEDVFGFRSFWREKNGFRGGFGGRAYRAKSKEQRAKSKE